MFSHWYDLIVHSVRGRMIAGVVLVHAVLMTLVVIDNVRHQQSFMQQQLTHNGQTLARTLAVNVPSWLIANDVNGMHELLESLQSSRNLQLAMILDAEGKVRASTDEGLMNLVLHDPISRQLVAGRGQQQLWHDGMVDSAAEIVTGGQSIGHARVILNAAPLEAELKTVIRQGIYYVLFAIGVGAVVAWLLVRTMTQRLERLSDAADQVASGDLTAELLHDPGRDEVARLTTDFRAMVQALASDRRQRDEAEAILFAEKERAQVTLASIGDAVITTDVAGRVTFLNYVAEQMTGWSNQQAQGQDLETVFRIISEETLQSLENPVEIVLRTGVVVGLANHTVLIRRDGTQLNIEDSAAPIRNREGDIIGVVLVFHDVTQAHEMAKQMGWDATHDALTGLFNRAEFERRLQRLLADRELGHGHVLLYIDLDQFKVVNDTCGHAAGDQLLAQISAEMRSSIRDVDILARLGGDEFGVLLENCPFDKGLHIAEQILEAVRAMRFVWEGKLFQIGASIGLVEVAGADLDGIQLLAAADTACYAAKDEGRNRVQVFNADDIETVRRTGEMHWVAHINHAFDERRFRLYWQQIISSTNQDYRHGELLIRMLDPGGGLVPPSAFLPAAERYNLMPRLDRWVVKEAVHWLAGHPDASLSCSVNLSGQSLSDDLLLDFVLGQLQLSGLDPRRICFEITETAAIVNLTKAMRFIGSLRSHGCRFSLDDFGSGLSSFGYLKNIPVDYVKIDGGFVRNIAHSDIDRAMVAAINEIGHVMGLSTIAEFVENDEIIAILKQQGVDYLQGYAIAKPVPLDAV